MSDGKTVGLVIAGVALIAATALIVVAVTGKGSDKITTIVKKGPSAWVRPWAWSDHPVWVGGGGYSGGGGGHSGGGGHHQQHGGGGHGGGGHVL